MQFINDNGRTQRNVYVQTEWLLFQTYIKSKGLKVEDMLQFNGPLCDAFFLANTISKINLRPGSGGVIYGGRDCSTAREK